MANQTGGSDASGPPIVTAEQRAAERQIHAGAEGAGVRIAGLTDLDEHVDSFAGHKDNPVKIGQKTTVRVRVAEDGTLLPRIEDSDASTAPATSILTIQVIPSIEFDSNGDAHTVWNGYARQVDVATTRVFAADRSGPSGAKEKALQAGRPLHEYGNDPVYKQGMLEDMARSPAEAVTQALTPLVGANGKLKIGREDRPGRNRPRSGAKNPRLVAAVGVPIVIAGIVIGFLAFGGSDSDPPRLQSREPVPKPRTRTDLPEIQVNSPRPLTRRQSRTLMKMSPNRSRHPNHSRRPNQKQTRIRFPGTLWTWRPRHSRTLWPSYPQLQL